MLVFGITEENNPGVLMLDWLVEKNLEVKTELGDMLSVSTFSLPSFLKAAENTTLPRNSVRFSSVQFSHSAVSDSLWWDSAKAGPLRTKPGQGQAEGGGFLAASRVDAMSTVSSAVAWSKILGFFSGKMVKKKKKNNKPKAHHLSLIFLMEIIKK